VTTDFANYNIQPLIMTTNHFNNNQARAYTTHLRIASTTEKGIFQRMQPR
jgi:hypothetical protein